MSDGVAFVNADELDDDDRKMLDLIAGAVAEKLRPILEPAQVPDYAVTWFREIAKFGVVHHQLVVPGYGSQYGPIVQLRFLPDGTAELVLCDMNCSPFWRITLRGADCPSSPGPGPADEV